MPTPKKQPNGNWRVRVFLYTDAQGKKHMRSLTAHTKKECERMAAEFMLNRSESLGNNKTVFKALNEYIENKSEILSPSTLRMYKSYVRNKFNNFGFYKIKDLTDNLVQGLVNEWSAKSSPKSVRNMYFFLTAALAPITFNVKLPQKIKTEIKIPSEDDMKKILCLIKNTDLEIPVLLAAHMGLRRSEICALNWQDINFDKHLLSINKAVVVSDGGAEVLKTTKTTSSTRTLPIPPSVYESLLKYRQSEGPLFPYKLGIITEHFTKLLQRNGLPHYRFHDLRHYNASVMLALGIPDKYAMEIMGHSTNNMLKTVYQHTMSEKKKEVAKALADYFS